MPVLVTGIHAVRQFPRFEMKNDQFVQILKLSRRPRRVGGRVKPGHDGRGL